MITLAVVAGAAAGVRVARSRHRRVLHPAGRSFAGELDVWGLARGLGSALVDRPGRHPVTVRISKGAGTRGARPDVLGVALRVAGHGDVLLSTVGTGRVLRHLPMPRCGFDSRYGSVLAYRTGAGRKVYLSAEPDLAGARLGRTLDAVAAAAAGGDARLLLGADDGKTGVRLFGRVRFGTPLPAAVDKALAFDPIANAPAGLHPTGLVHGLRGIVYPLAERWRGARPAGPDAAGVARTVAHR